MGWVENKFLDQIAKGKTLEALWHMMRDSLGTAAMEFSARVPDNRVNLLDCTSKGKYCVRLHKYAERTSLEVFIESDGLMTYELAKDPTQICGIRLTTDRTKCEFFIETGDGVRVLNAEEACEMAIASFLLTPFPRFLDPPSDR